MLPIKHITIGVGLFVAGGITGYFTAKHFLREGYEADVEEVQAWYREKLQESLWPSGEESPTTINDEEDEEEPEDDGPKATIDGRKVVNYDRFSKPPLSTLRKRMNDPNFSEDDDQDVDEQEEDRQETKDDDQDVDDPEYLAEIEKRSDEFIEAQRDARNKGEPYCIEFEEFQDVPEGYRTQDLYYYRKDRTLCEDDDQEVDDVEEVVGLDFEEVLRMQTQCFIRNDKLCCFYHVYRVEGAYETDVRGVIETPKERDYRVMGRRKLAIDSDE